MGDAVALARLLQLPAADLTLIRRIICRHSEILEFAAHGASRPDRIVVKRTTQFVSEQEAAGDLRREFEALLAVRRQLDEPMSETVPRALALSESDKILVLSRVPGEPLDRRFRRQANWLTGHLRPGSLRPAARLTGAWLARFHARTAAASEPFRAQPFLDCARERLARCQRQGLESRAAAAIAAQLEQASLRQEGKPVGMAARHGDFIPQNILIEAGRVGCVDFQNFSARAAVYEDVATFVGHILFLATPPYATWALRAAVASFLEGYGEKLDAALLDLYILSACVLTVAEAGPTRIPSRILHPPGLQTRLLTLSRRLNGRMA